MNIVFSTDQTYLYGGIEKVMATKANYLAKHPDMKVYIVTTEQQGHPPCYPLDERIKLIDLEVNYNRAKSYFSGGNIKKAFQHFRRQKRIFRQLQPDVIISPNFNFDFYWLPFIARKAKKIKEIHGSRYNWKPSVRNRIDAWFEKQYDAIVVLNKDEAKYFQSDNVLVIPNPIEKREEQCLLVNKQVIAAGRISPVKGFDELICAWKIVHRSFPDWQLHIYGQDYLGTQARLQQEIAAAGLQDVVLFRGNVQNLPKTMLDYSIYAMSSVTECFPMVLLEAISVGLPVVSYDCPNGPRNIIADGDDGVLTGYRNPKALADGLIRLMVDYKLRLAMGQEAKASSSRFEVDSVMPQWVSLLIEMK